MKLSPRAMSVFAQQGITEDQAKALLLEWRKQNPHLSDIWAHDEFIAKDCVVLHKSKKKEQS